MDEVAADDVATLRLKLALKEAEAEELSQQLTAMTKKLHGATHALEQAIATPDILPSYMMGKVYEQLKKGTLPCPHDYSLVQALRQLAAIRSYLDEDKGVWAPDIYELLGDPSEFSVEAKPAEGRPYPGLPISHLLRRDIGRTIMVGLTKAGPRPTDGAEWDVTPIINTVSEYFQEHYIIVPKPAAP